ncbi:unnamed protein product [Calypogeia fissa]
MKRSVIGRTSDGYREREDKKHWFEGPENTKGESKGHDHGAGTSNRTSEIENESVSRRDIRGKDRTRNSGDMSELPKEISSERSPRVKKKSGQRRVDGCWDDLEEGRASGRGKRSREDGWRDSSRGKDRGGGTPHEDSDDGSNGPSGRKAEDSRGYGPQLRIGAVEDRCEFEGTGRPRRLKTGRREDDRIERISVPDESEPGNEDSEDAFRVSGRVRVEQWEDYELRKTRGENEAEKGEKQRDNVGRERSEGSKVAPDNFGKPGRRSRGNEENREKSKPGAVGDGTRNEQEDGGKAIGRRGGGKTLKEPWISHSRKDTHGDWADTEWGWNDNEDFEQDRASRAERERNGQGYSEGSRGHDMDNKYPWARERRREWEEGLGGASERMRDRYRGEEDQTNEFSQDLDKKTERADRERLGRERMDGYVSDRGLQNKERFEGSSGPNGMLPGNESLVAAATNVALQLTLDPGRGIVPEGLCLPRAGGESGGVPAEFLGGGGEFDWEGPGQEERVRSVDGGLTDNRERHLAEDEPPPGLEHQVLGPSPGRVGVTDMGMAFNLQGGKGRSKSSSSNRSRGAIIVNDGRPNFVNNVGTGVMIRGFQPGGKGGRGMRGPGKVVRGGCRDGQRGNLPVISQLGPGMPGPLFGQLGPPGPMAGLGPGIIGPGAFPMPPFGGRMGWNGGGDVGMLGGPSGPVGGPPRFVPGMGPGPPGHGPNMYFNAPGPVRGGPSAISLGTICGGNSSFNGRPLPGDRGPHGGRSLARGGGPTGLAGRGPSRGEQNDYSQHFVDTGLRPQNFIRDVELADRFEEYPKLKELISRKDKLISERATPPMYLQCDLREVELRPEVFGTKFDVILVDPPWEEYVRRAPGVGDSMEWWSHSDIQSLRIEAISDTPSFIFLWVGDAEGLDQGRLCLKKWGFRRCEDICWVKTNRENPTPALRHDANTLLQHSKEHCLMGIKGTVRRSTDGHIIHANVDTDIIISEEPDYGSTAKPEELYHIIEHFAQGQRRLELFGEDHNIRAGWVTVGKGLSSSNFSPQTYAKHFFDGEGKLWQGGRGNPPSDAPHLVGTTSEIESLRPKSPPPRAQQQPQAHTANGVPPSGTSANGKRPFTTSQGGLPNLAPAVVNATLVPVETAPSGVGGKAVNHTQISKTTETVAPRDTKSSGATDEAIGPTNATNEEQSVATEIVEVKSEVESGKSSDNRQRLSNGLWAVPRKEACPEAI